MKIAGFEVSLKWVLIAVLAIAVLGVSVSTLGINDAGHRTVVQYPNGYLFVKFTPGIYLKFFGTVTEYNDLITFNFDRDEPTGAASIDEKGIAVRYQDGGMGTIYGNARFALPNDEAMMLDLHKAFRSNYGVANKLIKPVAQEALNLTAGLMTSEESYTQKRGIYTRWAKEQMGRGIFHTELREIVIEEEPGKQTVKKIPVIKFGEDGQPSISKSDLLEYGINLTGFQVTEWNFEEKTLAQIDEKRDATMGIITAKANAEKAKQDARTAEEEGKALVMTARYEMEVVKEKAVVTAQQKVEVAKQARLEAEQKKLAATEYKQEQILRGEGDGAYKRLVMQADGALTQKLKVYKEVMFKAFEEFGKQKWVPEIMMGTSGDASSSSATTMIEALSIKALKDLSLDMSTKSKK